MSHVSKAYFAGAKMAYSSADKCARDAETTDLGDAWRAHLLAEEKRHRERGDWYLHHARQWAPQQERAA
jgi:hypothetical protein